MRKPKNEAVQVFFLKWRKNCGESSYMNYVTVGVSTQLWNKVDSYDHF